MNERANGWPPTPPPGAVGKTSKLRLLIRPLRKEVTHLSSIAQSAKEDHAKSQFYKLYYSYQEHPTGTKKALEECW
jgi:hypothetical protein